MEYNFLHYLPPFVAGDESIPFFAAGLGDRSTFAALLGSSLFGYADADSSGCMKWGIIYIAATIGVYATLPFFIPAPTLIGTLGAVILIKSPIRSRAALFDIGIAGPIAGFVAAVITLVAALLLSKPITVRMGRSDLQWAIH